MNTWTKQKLGDVVTFRTGKLNSNAAVVDGKYPFFTCSQEIYKTNTFNFDTECVLLGGNNASAVYPIFYFNGKFDAYQRTYVIEPKKKNNTRFLYFALRKKLSELQKQSTGATTKFLTLKILNGMQIEIADISTQTRIASILSTYDDLIENNDKRIKALEEMAQLLYSDWFVKYEFPGREKVKMVDSGTEYGKIPAGWKVKKLSEVASIVRGCSYSSEEIDDQAGDYYIVNLKSFNRGGGFRFDGAKYYSGAITDNQLLKAGDVVVAVTDMTNDRAVIARPARVPELAGKITLSADAVKINSDILPSSFIYELLLSYRFTETTKQKANGANVLHLKPAAILEFVALIPDAKSLKEFNVYCKPTINEVDKLLKQNDVLKKTRDLLIPQLVTGKRELKEGVISPIQITQSKDVFKDAVVFSYYVKKASTSTFNPTHLRAVKSVYFANRFCGIDPVLNYSEDRFGPYNPKHTYGGGESLALKKKYVERIKGGFKSGAKADEISSYPYNELSAVDKVLSFLKYKKDTELELLATVDYILYKMLKGGEKPTANSVYNYIEQNKVWKQKIDRLKLSVDKISEVMNTLRELAKNGLVYPTLAV